MSDIPSTSTNAPVDLTFNNYIIINSLEQLPKINPNISPLEWTLCAITTFNHYSQDIVNKDPYLRAITRYFLKNNVICSTELCQSVSFCHPLWLALELSNRVKKDPKAAHVYKNKYIHPITPLNMELHIQQHINV
jgi:hypothetical protein